MVTVRSGVRGRAWTLFNDVYVGSLNASLADHYFELYFLAFGKGFISFGMDGRKMNKDIFLPIPLDKSEAFRFIKPLDSACFQGSLLVLTNAVRFLAILLWEKKICKVLFAPGV